MKLAEPKAPVARRGASIQPTVTKLETVRGATEPWLNDSIAELMRFLEFTCWPMVFLGSTKQPINLGKVQENDSNEDHNDCCRNKNIHAKNDKL